VTLHHSGRGFGRFKSRLRDQSFQLLANWSLGLAFICIPQDGYNSHDEDEIMRSVNIAELKNQLSKYLTFAKGGEEIVIRHRNLPVAKLVPFSAEEASEEELLLVASGKMRLPQNPLNVDRLLKIPTGKVSGNKAVQALLDDRAESL
jgi:prevent-host-death family protein